MNIHGRLFQARMWREYAEELKNPCSFNSVVMRMPREECLRRARVNVYLARRLNRQSAGGSKASA